MSRSRPFRYTAHAANVAGCRMSFAHSNRSGWRMVLGAVSGIETSSLRDSTGQRALRAPRTAESWCSERNPAAPSRSWRRAKHRHGLARARPDSPALRPLHSATRTALQATRTFRCIPTVANCRDRRERRALPRWKFRESGQLSFRCATRNSPPSLQKRQWADTSFIRLRAVLRCAPCFPCRTSPDAPLAGRGVSTNRARAGATRPTNPGHESSTLALRTAGMKEQPTLRFSLRCEAGRRLCFPVATQGLLSAKPPQCRIPLRVNPRHRVPAGSPRDTRPPARFN
jgi:hypothetical protein